MPKQAKKTKTKKLYTRLKDENAPPNPRRPFHPKAKTDPKPRIDPPPL